MQTTPYPTQTPFLWPRGAKAAVSLTYDDSLDSQLDCAIPQLRAHGFAGTFFVNPGLPRDLARRDDWARVALSEQELGNHTLDHPCARNLAFVPKGGSLEDHDEARMAGQIEKALEAIRQLGAPAVPSFAYPCGQTFIGEDHRSYIPLVKRHHAFARGVEGAIADPTTVDLMEVPAHDGAMGADACLALVREALARGHWLVFLFHGIGAEHLPISVEEHAALLDGLKALGRDLWVGTFGDVGDYLRQNR